jgi:hypothetical protein
MDADNAGETKVGLHDGPRETDEEGACPSFLLGQHQGNQGASLNFRWFFNITRVD